MPRISVVAAAVRIYCRRNKRMTYTLKRSQVVKNDYRPLNCRLFRGAGLVLHHFKN